MKKILFPLLFAVLITTGCDLTSYSILNNTIWDSTTIISYESNTVTRKQYVEYHFQNTTFDVYLTLTESTDEVNYPNASRQLIYSGTYSINGDIVSVQVNDWEPWEYTLTGNTLIRDSEILTKQ